ncbi:cupin domain-containing protein [Peptococcus simiae]|uniref:Cupin domain-containing protein n=1 Tax=Peptococcus simiae TaxID=1643805 RepID=A0ABW9H1J7_9FIRM
MFKLKERAPFVLTDLVTGRPGQVASRHLSLNDLPAIGLFAFDGGEGIRDAHYEGETIYFGLEGAPLIQLQEAQDVLDPGDAFIVPGDMPHSIAGDRPFHLLRITLPVGEEHSQTRHLIKGHAVHLAEAMAYAEDEVVSLTICQRAELSLTVFACAAQTRIGRHKSQGDALALILEGTATITVGEETHQVHVGEALLMPAQVPHALTTEDGFKMLLIVSF